MERHVAEQDSIPLRQRLLDLYDHFRLRFHKHMMSAPDEVIDSRGRERDAAIPFLDVLGDTDVSCW